MVIAFWNVNRKKNNKIVAQLVTERFVDILVLIEYKEDYKELVQLLKQLDDRYSCSFRNVASDILVISRVKTEPALMGEFFSTYQIDDKFMMCAVHFPSRLYRDNADRVFKANQLKKDLYSIRKEIQCQPLIILGDFNDDPYNEMVGSALGFDGFPDKYDVRKGCRISNGISSEMLYNPMWNCMGDFNHPPGTYYKSEGKAFETRWHMWDQLLLSQEIMNKLVPESLEIVVQIGDEKLAKSNGQPNKKISDHFPVAFTLKEDIYERTI